VKEPVQTKHFVDYNNPRENLEILAPAAPDKQDVYLVCFSVARSRWGIPCTCNLDTRVFDISLRASLAPPLSLTSSTIYEPCASPHPESVDQRQSKLLPQSSWRKRSRPRPRDTYDQSSSQRVLCLFWFFILQNQKLLTAFRRFASRTLIKNSSPSTPLFSVNSHLSALKVATSVFVVRASAQYQFCR